MQTHLFEDAQIDRYTWQEGISAGSNPYHRLIDHGEETRWWVRHRINCKSQAPWFLVTDFGAYMLGTFADLNKAKEALIGIKDGKICV